MAVAVGVRLGVLASKLIWTVLLLASVCWTVAVAAQERRPEAAPASIATPADATPADATPADATAADAAPAETSGNDAAPVAPERPTTPQRPARGNDILRRLQREPLTLFDWGLANLERDLHRASQRLGEEDYASVAPRSSATYRWRDGRIRLSASFFVPAEARTAEGCVAQFRRLVGALVADAPQGPDAASWYLGSAFQPSGHFWTSRFEDTGAKLLQVVDLRVSLRAPSYDKLAGDTRRIDCSGSLDAAEETLRFEAIS